jgi:hydroxymethylbilane synthase
MPWRLHDVRKWSKISHMRTLRLGTRGSLLARTQSAIVAAELQARNVGLLIETTIITTTGDTILDKPLYDAGGKGLFIKELEQTLLDGRIDFAVHSYKDVPVTQPLVDQAGLTIAATPLRHDPRDVLISHSADSIAALPREARVATGSLRRRSQLLTLRPDLEMVPMRGNIDTRLKKLRGGECDAIVLAAAGIERAGLFDAAIMHLLEPDVMLSAPGQGALALQCRREDDLTIRILGSVNDTITQTCVGAERQIVQALHGDCHSPIAALATVEGDQFRLRTVVGTRGGQPPTVLAESAGSIAQLRAIITSVEQELLARGAAQML